MILCRYSVILAFNVILASNNDISELGVMVQIGNSSSWEVEATYFSVIAKRSAQFLQNPFSYN
jgi:hypothetical protein